MRGPTGPHRSIRDGAVGGLAIPAEAQNLHQETSPHRHARHTRDDSIHACAQADFSVVGVFGEYNSSWVSRLLSVS